MKQFILALSALVTITACNSNPKAPAPTETTALTDTTGLSAYQADKARYLVNGRELDSTNAVATRKATAPQHVRYVNSPRSTASSSSGGSTGSTSSGSGTAAAPAKKGISKTAKGAIIGGVAGAAGGAIINKKNRGAGAVVGGLLGAGVGAVIGNAQDKKDGRH